MYSVTLTLTVQLLIAYINRKQFNENILKSITRKYWNFAKRLTSEKNTFKLHSQWKNRISEIRKIFDTFKHYF